MGEVRFTSTRLAGINKRGVLTPDSDGYYTMPVGGLNVYNSVKEYYALDGAKELFEDSSVFMRRVASGVLKAEVGHPKLKPGMSKEDYFRRILTIDESNICAHFKEIWLDTTFGTNRPDLNNSAAVAIMAKVRPSGEKAYVLENAIKNPQENVCFSIRAITKDFYQRGQTVRILNMIVTFDLVNEPGIAYATKYDSPVLESLSDDPVLIKQLMNIAESGKKHPVALESTQLAIEAIRSIKLSENQKVAPIYSRWQ